MTPWMPWCHANYSIEDSRNWVTARALAWSNGEAYEFAMVDARDGSYLGGCGLNHIDSANKMANLGYWVRSSRTKRGVATAATMLLAEWGFRELKLNRIEIVVAIENHLSQNVAAKAGATSEGVLRNRLTLADRVHDAMMFSLVPQDLHIQV